MLMVMREIYASMGIFVEKQSEAEQQFSTNLPPSHGYSRPPGESTSPIDSGYQTAPQLFGIPPSTFPSSTVQQPLFMNPTPTVASQSFTNPPPLFPPTTSAVTGKPTIIGARPVVSPDAIKGGGWDPTAPINSTAPVGPPPLTGFQRKS